MTAPQAPQQVRSPKWRQEATCTFSRPHIWSLFGLACCLWIGLCWIIVFVFVSILSLFRLKPLWVVVKLGSDLNLCLFVFTIWSLKEVTSEGARVDQIFKLCLIVTSNHNLCQLLEMNEQKCNNCFYCSCISFATARLFQGPHRHSRYTKTRSPIWTVMPPAWHN